MGSDVTNSDARTPLWVAFFIIGLIIPLFIFIGPIRLTIYRVILLLMLFPMLYLLFSGRVGRLQLPDICVILICIWSTLSLIIVHGILPMIEPIGILWIETLGSYLIGRCFVRTPDDFFAVIRFLFCISIIMIPFAIHEAQTGQSILIRAFDVVGASYPQNNQAARHGFERVQGPFAHPIHFGVFFGSLIGLAYYVLGYGRSGLKRILPALICLLLCFSSMSSGPLASAMAQLCFILWDGLLNKVKSRWNILAGLSIFAYVILDILSNRTPFAIFISLFAFNVHSAYNRINIWNFGTKSIWDNPVFGIGLSDDWGQPAWMGTSVDMFWILPAMRHGVVVWVLWLALFFMVFLGVANRRNFDQRMQWYRMGYLCSLSGLFMAGWTVHYWDGAYVAFMFIFSSGIWMLNWKPDAEGTLNESKSSIDTGLKGIGYTRFPARVSEVPAEVKNTRQRL